MQCRLLLGPENGRVLDIEDPPPTLAFLARVEVPGGFRELEAIYERRHIWGTGPPVQYQFQRYVNPTKGK